MHPITVRELDAMAAQPVPPRSAILRCLERARLDKRPVLQFSPADHTLIREATEMADRCLGALFPTTTSLVPHIEEYLAAAHRAASTIYGTAAAVEWGGDYQFPSSLLQRDVTDFITSGSTLPDLARSRRAFSLTTSFSRQRVEQSFGIDGSLYPALTPEDFRRLLRLADVGVDIPKPGRFVPVRTLAPLRTKYIQVQSAVHKILAKQAISGTVVILPTTLATEIPGIHLHNSQHWTLKRGKPCGRTIADLSNTPDPLLHCPLNGSTIEERLVLTQDCISLYGPIKLPTIQELLLMVLQVADEHGWESICLWKMDLQGAFNLLWINPDDTPLLAFPLTNDLVVIHLVGIFGWLGMPFAFNVLSRTLLILILAVIKGKAAMYVDDVMGCSALDNIDEDMAATHTAITGLAGDHSIAPDKVERGRSLE